ncbi:MAG: hypothetical protein KAH25_01155 [Bacteroidales bacterium]|nr:hypothetical protein [Bacteroidales bacterium]
MRNIYKSIILYSLLILISSISMPAKSQTAPPPPGGHGGSNDTPPGGGAPIAGGLAIFMVLGGIYSGRKIYQAKLKEAI